FASYARFAPKVGGATGDRDRRLARRAGPAAGRALWRSTVRAASAGRLTAGRSACRPPRRDGPPPGVRRLRTSIWKPHTGRSRGAPAPESSVLSENWLTGVAPLCVRARRLAERVHRCHPP